MRDNPRFIYQTESSLISKKGFSILATLSMLISLLGCTTADKHPEDKLAGSWLRADGNYTIEIKAANEDGKLDAAYFNPDTINVGRAGWRMKNDALQIYVELRDVNYPGSIYQLTYNDESDQLSGTYYQAVSRQTFEVKFKRNENK
jgi:hypothetical protein